jgi:hypothetical protein
MMVPGRAGNPRSGSGFAARAHPADAVTGRGAEAVAELGGVVLDVAEVDDLVLQLGDTVPVEPALRAGEVDRAARGLIWTLLTRSARACYRSLRPVGGSPWRRR